jgi:hypothetical protein
VIGAAKELVMDRKEKEKNELATVGERVADVARRHGRRGQAVTEYTLLMVVLTCGSLFAGFTFFPRFINAFQRYFDSFYILINLPIP